MHNNICSLEMEFELPQIVQREFLKYDIKAGTAVYNAFLLLL